MKTEYNLLFENNVWEVVDNQELKPIGSRWHIALKCGPSGEIARYKARLVAKGFSQVPGRDYEAYSPTTRVSAIRIFLSYSLRNDSELKQMDIKTAYLNADIDEEIFMQEPEGFEKYNEQGNPLVCKLNKSSYGLKQCGRNWYLTIKSFLGGLGFVSSIQDECLFIKKGQRRYGMNDLSWVDDMFI